MQPGPPPSDAVRVAIVLSTAPHDETAAESLDLATKRYRAGLKIAAQRLESLDALKPSVSVDHATDVLWFLFGYSGYFTLVDDNGWTLEEARDWLRTTAWRSCFNERLFLLRTG